MCYMFVNLACAPADPAPHAQLAPALQVLPLVERGAASAFPRRGGQPPGPAALPGPGVPQPRGCFSPRDGRVGAPQPAQGSGPPAREARGPPGGCSGRWRGRVVSAALPPPAGRCLSWGMSLCFALMFICSWYYALCAMLVRRLHLQVHRVPRVSRRPRQPSQAPRACLALPLGLSVSQGRSHAVSAACL